MAYSVHIIRVSQEGGKGESLPITLDEWLASLSQILEMRFKGEAIFTAPKGETIKWNAPGLTQWVASDSRSAAWFDHVGTGRVSVGNPSQETLVKMFEIAKALGAIVRGDDGERYDASGNTCQG